MNSEELKAKRKLFKLTQQELGVMVGYPEAQAAKRIYDYECGRRNLSLASAKFMTTIFEKLESESK